MGNVKNETVNDLIVEKAEGSPTMGLPFSWLISLIALIKHESIV